MIGDIIGPKRVGHRQVSDRLDNARWCVNVLRNSPHESDPTPGADRLHELCRSTSTVTELATCGR